MKKQIEIGGRKIFCSVSGNGKHVILVHEFGEIASPNPSEGGLFFALSRLFDVSNSLDYFQFSEF